VSRAGPGPAFPVAVRVGARRGNPCIVAFSAARGKAAPYAAVLHGGNAVIHPRQDEAPTASADPRHAG
jgi:hypothetical protein